MASCLRVAVDKDQVIFLSEEEEVEIVNGSDGGMEDSIREAVKEDGEIDWDCPCLQGMAKGPCGEAFKSAFSCFAASTAEEKGSDCLPFFRSLHACFDAHPEIFDNVKDERDKQDAAQAEKTAEGEALSDSTNDNNDNNSSNIDITVNAEGDNAARTENNTPTSDSSIDARNNTSNDVNQSHQ